MSEVNLKPYKPGWANMEGKNYVNGPGQSYYQSIDLFASEEDCKSATNIANEAYKQGYRQAQSDIRQSLGIKI
jgi:hypothetical protein